MTATSEPSLGELVASATADLSRLVKTEVALAKVELKREAVAAGKGVGMFAGAGGAALFALIFLSIALAYGVSALGLPLGAGFLVVGLLYLLAAGLLGLLGKKNLAKVGKPEKTLATVRDDIAWAKHPTRRA